MRLGYVCEGSTACVIEPRRNIDQGITRIYRFVEASARMSAPLDDPPVDFLILEAVEEARRELTELSSGRVRVETNPGTANPRCHGHRGRFVLALINLMRNAVQAGGPNIEISIVLDATDPSLTTLSIADDGPGVADELRERVFTNGMSSRADGSGHGLALVREVVEQELGGRVTLEPKTEHGGARFCLAVPSAEPESK